MILDFYNHTLGIPELPGAVEEEVWRLCVNHVEETERFDASVCRYKHRGIAMPVTPSERRLCTQNALRSRKELLHTAASKQVSSEVVERMIREADRRQNDRLRRDSKDS